MFLKTLSFLKGLGILQTVGRQRPLAFDMHKKQLWKKAKNSLMNPIFKKVYVQGLKPSKDTLLPV
jgi:hypothetical protein